MNWLLFMKLEANEYIIKQAGSNLVPSESYDKVIPTTEQIARQPEKVYFDGERLRLKEGAKLLTIDELNSLSVGDRGGFTIEPSQEIFDIE